MSRSPISAASKTGPGIPMGYPRAAAMYPARSDPAVILGKIFFQAQTGLHDLSGCLYPHIAGSAMAPR